MTVKAKKPRVRKPKAEAVPTPPPPCEPVCPECKRRLEIETVVRRQIKDTQNLLESALQYLDGHNYTTILSYLSNAHGSLSPAVESIRKLYHEQEDARQKVQK